MDNSFDPTDINVLLLNFKEEKKKLDGLQDAIVKLSMLCNQPHGTAFSQIQQFRKLVPKILNLILFQAKIIDGLEESFDRIVNNMSKNNGKKWTREEDDLLIEIVARGELTIAEIAITFGRTPSAITTRVSYLVGIKRVSEEIAGRFTGYLDGRSVEGFIKGTVRK